MLNWAAVARRIRVPLGFALALLYIWLARPSVLSLLAGAILVAPGLALRALASGHLRKNEQLAVGGPYAYTRNPLYLGSLILGCGFVLAARSWWIAATVAIFFLVVYVPVIQSEEAFLRKQFPEFAEYATHVPRLWPRLRGRHPSSEGSFSWALYLKHREYNALLGAAALTGVLATKLIFRW